jgi:glycosyltransferase involved in cell wall biosynthesis
MLAKAGYKVELFLYNTATYVELERLTEQRKIQIYDLSTSVASRSCSTTADWVHRIKQIAKACLGYLRRNLASPQGRFDSVVQNIIFRAYQFTRNSHQEIVPSTIVNRALELMTDKDYRCVIGVEKRGLIWAKEVASRLGVGYIYYSLELYTEDFERLIIGYSPSFTQLRLLERNCHQKAFATIIQDPERAQVLFRDNGLSMSEATIYYIPVSLIGGPYKRRSRFFHEVLGIRRSRFFHEVLGISDDKKVILYFGLIVEARYALELARVAQSFPDDWVLVLHGWGTSATIKEVKALDRREKVKMSLGMVPSGRLQDVVASADVGLVFYSPTINNDRMTAFSSEKMAIYAQCGVPFIAFDYPGYRRLANEDRFGLVIDSLDDMPDAIGRILTSHEEFRQNAYQAFDKYYNFASNFSRVIESIEHF